VRFVSAPPTQEPALSLLGGMRKEIAELYDDLDIDGPDMPKAGPEEFALPSGDFLVGEDEEGDAVCCGGIKRLPDGACEFKRMYVLPAARGQGVARRLLAALEARARELGYTIARLDTGPRQPHSHHLYVSAGYRTIENFNANPMATYFGEKAL
jgi:GNAT superfamily N-acetyltransferase